MTQLCRNVRQVELYLRGIAIHDRKTWSIMRAKDAIAHNRPGLGSSPRGSTIYEKSELISDWKWVRIFHFYQGYFLLMFIPGGFFILRVFLLFAHSILDRSPATMIAENH